MSDAFRKVRPGERFTMPASAYNAFIDAALDHQQRQGIGGGKPPSIRQPGIIKIQNDSGADIAQFGVLGIDDSIFDPDSALESFQSFPLLSGINPVAGTHEGRFVITVEPIKAGEIGHAYAAGVCPAAINVVSALHRFAEIVDGDPTTLASAAAGSCEILWVESGTGPSWGFVRFGSSVPAGTILVANNEASECPIGGMMRITGNGLDRYYEGSKPTAANMQNIAIAQAAIPAATIGVCKIDGITVIETALATLAAGDFVGSIASSWAAGVGGTHQVLFTEAAGATVYGHRVTGTILKAKAQENAQADPGLSVKLLDIAGNANGAPFDVANIEGADWDDCWPLVVANDLLLVTYVNGAWFALGFTSVGACA